jgi:hypothetical protein
MSETTTAAAAFDPAADAMTTIAVDGRRAGWRRSSGLVR